MTQQSFPVLPNKMKRHCFDAETTSLLTQFVTRKIPFFALPRDLKNLISNQRLLMGKNDPEMLKRMTKKMRKDLLVTRAFEFKQRAESVLQDEKDVIQTFKRTMNDAENLLTNVSNEDEKTRLVYRTEKQIRVILEEYPEVYIGCTGKTEDQTKKDEAKKKKEEEEVSQGKVVKFRPYRRYESKALDMETERFEYDRRVNVMKSTAEIMARIIDGSREHVLKPIHLQCIREMYGDYGDEFVEQLHEKPDVAMLVFYDRLCQKLEEAKDAKNTIDEDLKMALRRFGS